MYDPGSSTYIIHVIYHDTNNVVFKSQNVSTFVVINNSRILFLYIFLKIKFTLEK